MKRREISLHHTVVFTLVKDAGVFDRRIHTLYLLQPGKAPAPFIPLLEYIIEQGRARYHSWQRDISRSIGLFVDFLVAKTSDFENKQSPKVIAAFSEALVYGTIGDDGLDHSGLYWQPREVSRASSILRSVTAFSDWLENRYSARKINPWRESTTAEKIAYWRRLDKRGATQLLGYTTSKTDHIKRASRSRSVTIPKRRVVAIGGEVKIFPRERIWDLLSKGFLVPGKQKSLSLHEKLNIRDILITILLHGGGLRESEPFHLYVTDVGADPANPNSALIRMYHPDQGDAPPDYVDPISGKRIYAKREEYLKYRWQMQSRNQVEGRFKAGWKDLFLFDEKEKFAYVHWFPTYWGEVFLSYFKLYITHCRSRHCKHPFLFVSQKDDYDGDPYTVDAFRQAHDRAIRRIGLEPSKMLGTTPHGHRHAYGQTLADCNVDELTIQRVMHHKSPSSQIIYTAPPGGKIVATLEEAQKRLSDPLRSALPSEMTLSVRKMLLLK